MHERPDQYYIPDNLNNRKKFFGVPNRNLIETAIVEFVIILIARLFNMSVPLIVILILLMLGLGIFLIIGIHHESVTEFIITTIKFKSRKAKYHLRKVTDKDDEIIEEEQRENEKVIGEDIFEEIKEKFFGKKKRES